MFSTFMLTIEIYFLFFLSFVNSQRYYAFVETLFVIDQIYFPQLSLISYEEYIRTIVDTTNIIFQTQNDLDIKIEIVTSKIVYLTIMEARSQQPYEYEPKLRQQVPDYDRYDSVVLLSYQPWEGSNGAQGYAMLKGACDSKNKIMYLLPYQNAAFYLAHEFGHQLGLQHQIDTPCFTKSYMSVMTRSHTASFEQARWTTCENQWINSHICEFQCLFNKPDQYQPIKSKYSTLPGQRMNNNQQSKMMESTQQALGENLNYAYMPSESPSRCLYLRYSIGGSTGEFITAFSPMLPGSDCGANSICHVDQCVLKDSIDPSFLKTEYDTNILDLTKHCASGGDVNVLKATNHDSQHVIQCTNWEDDYLCEQSRACPESNDESVGGLYIRHVCCKKCSPIPTEVITLFSQGNRKQTCSIIISIILINLAFFI